MGLKLVQKILIGMLLFGFATAQASIEADLMVRDAMSDLKLQKTHRNHDKSLLKQRQDFQNLFDVKNTDDCTGSGTSGAASAACWHKCGSQEGYSSSTCAGRCGVSTPEGSAACWNKCGSMEGYSSSTCAIRCEVSTSQGSAACWNKCGSMEGYSSTTCAGRCGVSTSGGSQACWYKCSLQEGNSSSTCVKICGVN